MVINNKDWKDYCLRKKGIGQQCEDCPIKARGLEKQFLVILQKIYSFYNYGGKISTADFEDIIGNFKEAVFKNIDRLEDTAFFNAWCHRIFSNKKNDHLREKYKYADFQEELKRNQIIYKQGKIDVTVDALPVSEESDELSTDEMLVRLKLLIKDEPKCVNFIINVVRWTRTNLSKKQMAEKVGKTYDTFRQYYHRCMGKLKALVQGT